MSGIPTTVCSACERGGEGGRGVSHVRFSVQGEEALENGLLGIPPVRCMQDAFVSRAPHYC